MPNPFWSALAPSVAGSLAGGAAGALQGQAAGEDRDLNNQLKQAQIGWQQAHAAMYGHTQRVSSDALAKMQALIAQHGDAAFSMPEGRMYQMMLPGHSDLGFMDARTQAALDLAGQRRALSGLYGSREDTENQLRDPRVFSTGALGNQRQAMADQTTALTQPKVGEVGSRTELNQARVKSEGALQNMRNWQGQLAKERAALQSQMVKAGQGGKSMNLYSLANMMNDRINGALDAGQDPDPNDVLLYDDLRTKIRGSEYGVMPLGSPGTYNKETGQMTQPDVPAKPGGFFSSPQPAVPGSPPTKLPLNLTPRTPKALAPTAAARPGALQQDQDRLKAQKLIKERGQKFASDQLKSNKALTPTERLALQDALEKAMTESSITAP